ncbi:MAG: hypothetical protein WEE67_01235 [Chloroflexota bacterium]
MDEGSRTFPRLMNGAGSAARGAVEPLAKEGVAPHAIYNRLL